jgi:hypothetical protein
MAGGDISQRLQKQKPRLRGRGFFTVGERTAQAEIFASSSVGSRST